MNHGIHKNMRLTLILPLICVATLSANDFNLDWWTVDGGGETQCSGGDFDLAGTIGQPDAGPIMTGGEYELASGLWPGAAVSEQTPCIGDLDGDRDIDLADLAQLIANYGEMNGMTYEDGDLDGDGDVDLSDLAELLARYGEVCE